MPIMMFKSFRTNFPQESAMTFTLHRFWNSLWKTTVSCVIALGVLGQAHSVNAACFQDEEGDDAAEAVDQAVGGIIAVQQAWGGEQTHSKKYVQAVKKLDVILQLQMQVDELKEVCGLDDSQAQKLNIAAKAAAQKQVEKWTKTMDEFQMWESMGANKDDDKNVRLDEIDLSKVDPNILQWLSTDFTGEMRNGPGDEKVWKKALKSALSDEQKEKLEAHRQKRKEKLMETTVQFFAQMYGSQLLLDDEQEKAFAKAIKKRMTDENVPLSVDESYNTMMLVATIRPKELAEFMSDKQLDRWRILTGPYGNAGIFQADIVDEAVEEDPDNEETDEGDDG